MKTNKSYKKRIKVTKNGKVLARKTGQDHFNSKNTGTQRLAKKRMRKLKLSQRIKRRFLAGV
jgi:ribosomal protein L35